MNDDALRIAVAEACGLPVDVCMCGDSINGTHYGHQFTPMCSLDEVPNYHADLNAMHEAEKTLSSEEFDDKYYFWLCAAVAGRETMQTWEYRKLVVHATSRQRAEAFLKTKGLWKP